MKILFYLAIFVNLLLSGELVQGGNNDNGPFSLSKWDRMINTGKIDKAVLTCEGQPCLSVVPAAKFAGMYQEIPTVIGQTYKVTAQLLGANHHKSADNFRSGRSYITIDNTIPNANKKANHTSKMIGGEIVEQIEFTFEATSNTSYVSLRGDKAWAYPNVRSISIKELGAIAKAPVTTIPVVKELGATIKAPVIPAPVVKAPATPAPVAKAPATPAPVVKAPVKNNRVATPYVAPVHTNKPWGHGILRVSADKHMLQHKDGTGFFWLGDTAWAATVKLDSSNMDIYFQSRQRNNFNVIQISAVTNQTTNNTQGELPFINADYKKPNEKYWAHLDSIITKAEQSGIYIALLPAWDMYFNTNTGLQNTNDANVYSTWIANRYKNRPNIIWVVGGDSGDQSDGNWAKKQSIWDTMGNAINNVVGSKQLITYHPSGAVSSKQWFGNAAWLDFSMIQSGHCGSMANARNLVTTEYNSSPIKPTLDAEPRYETILECFYQNGGAGTGKRFTSRDIRENAYTQVFSGSTGYTYGHHSIWQFWESGETSCCSNPTASWKTAINSDGTKYMGILAKLMRSRPILNRVPDQSMISGGNAIATRAQGYALVYLPRGGAVTVNLGKISGSQLKAWWYNPTTGDATSIETFNNVGTKTFTTGSDDMVLILDDTTKGFATPGL